MLVRTPGSKDSTLTRLPFSLPVRLALLVAGTTLPLILFAGGLVYSNYLQDQRDAFENVRQITRGIRLVVDRELQGILSGLTVLANSRALANDDFENFRISADAFVRQFPGNPSILIGGADGRAIFISSLPKGAPLPVRTERADRDEVFRTGKPAFSRLFIGSVSKRPVVTVSVPVMRDGKVLYELSFNPPLEIFQRIIEQQVPSEDWTFAIFDQNGRNFARIPNPNQTIGQQASPSLAAVMFDRPEGDARTVTLEGVPLLTFFSRSELSGWTTAGGVSHRTLTAPLLQNLALTGAIGLVMLLIGLGFAVQMATTIARAEMLHGLLINELNHRVKNTLATVQSLAGQTFRNAADGEAKQKFGGRLVALGRAHDLLSEEKWDGANVHEVVETVLAPFQASAGDRINADGPPLRMSARNVVMLAMVLQELATNASKYGSLSVPDGRVVLDWEQTDENNEPWFTLAWIERGGPPVAKPTRTGFGSTLIGQGVTAQLGGKATLTFAAEGVTCTIAWPASRGG